MLLVTSERPAKLLQYTPPPLHIVDGNTVNHHGHVLALESTYIGLGIAETAALLCCPNAGSSLEHLRGGPGCRA